MKNLRFVCRFLRMSFFCACPGISPQRCLAHSLPERFSQGHIPFGRSFSFQFAPQLVGSEKAHLLTLSIINGNFFAVCTKEFLQTFCERWLQRQKEPVHSTSNQREKISRHIFDETMYRLCFSETFNVCFFRSAGRLSNRSGAAAISFDGCLVFHFRYSVVDSAMRARYSIAYRTLVRQAILTYCCRKSGCRLRGFSITDSPYSRQSRSEASRKRSCSALE